VGTNNPESNGESKAVLLFGRTEAEGSLSPEDEPTILAEDPAFDNFTTLTNPGDLDGDGLDELIITQITGPSSFYLVRGEDMSELATESVADLASQTWENGPSMDCVGPLGDADGDGTDDWYFGNRGYPWDYSLYGVIFLVTETPGGTAESPEVIVEPETAVEHYVTGRHEDQELGYDCVALDFDGDGVQDIHTRSRPTDGSYEYAVLPGHALLKGPAAPAPAGLQLTHRSYLNAGDYDGDGDDDLLVQYWDEELYPAGFSGVGILPGWDVPWDDPDFW